MRITVTQWLGALVGVMVLFGGGSSVHAAVAPSSLTFTVVDQFGAPLVTRTPQISVSDCDVSEIKRVAPTETPGTYMATLEWKAINDKTCVLTIGARGFITAASRVTTIEIGEGKTLSTPFYLDYSLVVRAFDDVNAAVGGALVIANGQQASHVVQNTYYIAAAGRGSLQVYDSALLLGTENTALTALSLSSETVTNVKLQGTTPCTVMNTSLQCSGLMAPTKLSARDQNGSAVADATISVFSDSNFSKYVSIRKNGNESGAIATTDGAGNASLALNPGTYYVRVSAVGFTDVLTTVTQGSGLLTKTFNLKRLSAGVPSPTASRVQVIGTPTASSNKVTQIQVTVTGGDTAATRLKSLPIKVVSSRGGIDTITYESAYTNGSGIATAYVSSGTQGPAAFFIYVDDVLLATQSLFFSEPAPVTNVAASPSKSTIISTPSPILADGIETVTITVVARSIEGAPIQRASVILKSTRNEDVLNGIELTTNDLGTASANFTTKKMGTAWISATIGGVTIHDIAVISVSPLVQ